MLEITKQEEKQRHEEKLKSIEEYFGSEESPGICPDSIYFDGKVDGVSKYVKVVPCNKEFCPVCGQPGSLVHRQAFARGLGKIKGAEVIGYFVFTFPEEIREKLKNRKLLGDIQDFVRDIFKDMDFILAGVSRWHWSGDENPGKWNPHLNVLIVLDKIRLSQLQCECDDRGGCGYIPGDKLQEIKNLFLYFIQMHLKFNISVVDVYYQFCTEDSRKVHKWKYITRPTLLNLNRYRWSNRAENFYRMFLYNYRNTRWWSLSYWNNIDVSEEFVGGLAVVNDDDIEWIFGGSFRMLLSSRFFDDYFYLGYGIFENSRDSPG